MFIFCRVGIKYELCVWCCRDCVYLWEYRRWARFKTQVDRKGILFNEIERVVVTFFSGNSGILLFEWFLKWQNRRQLRNVSCYSNILSLYFEFKLDEYQILVKIKRHYYRFSILERIPRKRFNSSIFFEVAIRVKTFDGSCKLSHACFRLTKNHSIISITYIPNRHKLRAFNVLIIKKMLDHFGSFCTNDLKP